MTGAPESSVGTTRFLESIQLTPARAELFDAAFTATPQYVPWPKAYGGDSVAQAIAAALQTVGDDRDLHSVHSSFLRPVEVGEPVRYEVEVIRDGRGYSTRHVRSIQHGKTAFLSTASFQVQEAGPTLAPPMPDVPAPETLPTAAEVLQARNDDASVYWSSGRGFDHRHVPSPLYAEHDGDRTPQQAVWIRAFEPLPDDSRTHQIAIAYTCDYTILEPSLRGLGLHWSTPGLVTASLDHAMWFHAPARADDWLLYVQESAGVQGARGLSTGRFFDRSGRLVATVAQEGMIRTP